VDDDNKVIFAPVKIISQGESTMWVDGLTPGIRVITLGQNFVASGEKVIPIDGSATSAIDASGDEDNS